MTSMCSSTSRIYTTTTVKAWVVSLQIGLFEAIDSAIASELKAGTSAISLENKTKTKTTTLKPSPTEPVDGPYPSAFMVIWDVPPVSGAAFYDFYSVPASFKSSLDNKCGHSLLRLSPSFEFDDPNTNSKAVKDKRAAGKSWGPNERPPPGTSGGFKKGSNSCKYIETQRGKAKIDCDGDISFACHEPDKTLAQAVAPYNGRCGKTENIRMLVAVCPLG
ncbi:hypothetical protein EJ08DRAFT_693601 [Tothia fuscella]|uniref:Uncharacterized protein n=1 Tax=Tothia fuscella TaxID=1048955 RepID=A0A9P4NY49_9PEZI|nr:hypothetical protein EJ08DRAFT_693601 [Tothia fuscella]